MEQEEHNVTPPEETLRPTPPAHEEKPVGPAVGTIIIVIILLIGGLYFWGAKLNTEKPVVDDSVTAEQITAEPDEKLQSLETQSSSDEINSIETDLNTTDLEGLDAELQNIEAELGI